MGKEYIISLLLSEMLLAKETCILKAQDRRSDLKPRCIYVTLAWSVFPSHSSYLKSDGFPGGWLVANPHRNFLSLCITDCYLIRIAPILKGNQCPLSGVLTLFHTESTSQALPPVKFISRCILFCAPDINERRNGIIMQWAWTMAGRSKPHYSPQTNSQSWFSVATSMLCMWANHVG